MKFIQKTSGVMIDAAQYWPYGSENSMHAIRRLVPQAVERASKTVKINTPKARLEMVPGDWVAINPIRILKPSLVPNSNKPTRTAPDGWDIVQPAIKPDSKKAEKIKKVAAED